MTLLIHTWPWEHTMITPISLKVQGKQVLVSHIVCMKQSTSSAPVIHNKMYV